MPTPKTWKIQKILANYGLGARRKVEQLIIEKRVHIGKRLALIGDRVSHHDKLFIDGKPLIKKNHASHVMLYHKPCGEVCSHSPNTPHNSVLVNLPPLQQQRWLMVGRLDVNTSGLLLLATDGDLVARLMHPATQTDREYLVRCFGRLNEQQLKRALCEGITIAGERLKLNDIVYCRDKRTNTVTNHWFTVCLQSGKKNEVRKLFNSQNLMVNRLKRVRYGPIFLPNNLKQGHYRYASKQQVNNLYAHCRLPTPAIYQPTLNR